MRQRNLEEAKTLSQDHKAKTGRGETQIQVSDVIAHDLNHYVTRPHHPTAVELLLL